LIRIGPVKNIQKNLNPHKIADFPLYFMNFPRLSPSGKENEALHDLESNAFY